MKDILLDDNNELRIEMGDFVTGESKEQHIGLILESMPGAWKESPLLGVGVRRSLSMPYNQNAFLKGTILKHLEYDDIEVDQVEILENKINVY